jgi:GNAT superfamily N-acetyltransferase
MATIRGIFGDAAQRLPTVGLRAHEPGDIGWVIERHAVLYGREYGFDARFELLVADIAAQFLRTFQPQRERCWIAEKDGERAGSVFVVRESDEVARLRLLLVEASARGLRIGERLVDECVRFARASGYRSLTLWTHSILHAARRIYERAGFVLTREKRHRSFGPELVGQDWDLAL